jgi:hypothetical protein
MKIKLYAFLFCLTSFQIGLMAQPCGAVPYITFAENTVDVCFGESGQNSATVIGGIGDIDYNWFPISGVANTVEFSVSSDTWIYLEITDDCFTVLDSIYVDVMTIVPTSIVVTNATNCPGQPGTLGSIQILPDAPTWNYTLTGAETSVGPILTSTFNNLPGGAAYWIKITNTNGCELDTLIQVGLGANAVIADFNNLVLQGNICHDDSLGVAEVLNVGGGITTPYNVYWMNADGVYDQITVNSGDGDLINNLPSGTWAVNIIDQEGCAWSEIFNISSPDVFEFDFDQTNPTCFGFTDGSLSLTVTGGNGGNSFLIQDESGSVLNMGGLPGTNFLGEGWYYTTVTDIAGCQSSDSIYIDAPNEIAATFSYDDPWCATDGDGAIYVTSVSNYHGNYNDLAFYWSPDYYGISGVGADELLNTNGGEHTLTINDSWGCYRIFDLFLWPDTIYFTSLGATISTDGTDGTLYCTAAGGDDPYDYLWTNLTTLDTYTTATVNGIQPGDYEIKVTDASDCFILDTVRIEMAEINESETINLTLTHSSNGEVIFQTENLLNEPCTLNIYSISGAIIEVINLETGTKSHSIKLTSGSYFYTVISPDLKILSSTNFSVTN